MVDYSKYNIGTVGVARKDEGLRQYMMSVYNYMTMALFITGLVAYFASNSSSFISLMYTADASGNGASVSMFGWIIALAPLAIVFGLSAKIYSMKMQTAQALFWVYSIVMGLSLTSIFVAFTSESIARAFFISASTFGGASIYGYVTKKDLTSMASFLIMGVIGLVIASLVNIFMQSSAIMFAVSLASVVIFTGLTAYDTQNLKKVYYTIGGASEEDKAKSSIMGALSLYINFINIFISLLQLLGDRK